MPVRREYVSSLYRDLLGREGSEGEIEGHLGNPSEADLRNLFLGSPEYTSTHGGTPTWRDVGGVVTPEPSSSGYDLQGKGTEPPPAAAPPPPPPRTDPWSGQGAVAPTSNIGAMTGYDAANFNDPNMQTLKYQVGRIASRYAPGDPTALNSLMNDPEFRRLFPNARVVDANSGRINFGTGGDVDVIQNFGAPNAKWAWQPQDGGTSGGTSSGSGTGSGAARTGAGSTIGDLRQLYSAVGQDVAGPGDAGITTGPLQQVGQDPLSLLISGALANFIGQEGRTTFGGDVQDALSGLLKRGGELPADQVARRFESARELLDKGRRTMINDLRGDLGNRNLLSEPGIPQGIETGGINRVTEAIAPEFSRALRDIYTDESAKSDARMMTALQMATGFSTDQARNLLAGIGEGTARQSALADIALRTLQNNQAWSMFLAEFGLKRDQVMYQIQNGQIDQILPILQAFLQLGGMANQGYV